MSATKNNRVQIIGNPLHYNGEWRKEGEVFEVLGNELDIWIAQGRVKLADPVTEEKPKAKK